MNGTFFRVLTALNIFNACVIAAVIRPDGCNHQSSSVQQNLQES
jgi:hypothetical protein